MKGSTGVFLSACSMKEIQIGRAARAPLSFDPRELLSSKPTQTEARRDGVYPMNQASAKSLDVPVFPATGLPRLLAL